MEIFKYTMIFFTVCAVIGLGASVQAFMDLWNDNTQDSDGKEKR